MFEQLKNTKKSFFVLTKFNNIEDKKIQEIKVGTKFIDFLEENYPKGFNLPTSFFLNNKELDPKDLDYVLQEGDLILAIHRPNDFIITPFIINMLISVAISFILSKIMPGPKAPSNRAGVDSNYESVYSTNVSQIQAKKNGTIPSLYGVTRSYPNLVCSTYKRYVDNKEHIYLTTNIGLGEYDIIQAYLDESKIEDFVEEYGINTIIGNTEDPNCILLEELAGGSCTPQESTTSIYSTVSFEEIKQNTVSQINFDEYFDNNSLPTKNSISSGVIKYGIITGSDLKRPGNKARAIADSKYRHIVKTVKEVSNVSLDDSYQSIGWYSINHDTDPIDKIEVDVVFQGGLYATTDEGEFTNATQSIKVYVFGYNDYGLSTYENIFTFDFSGNSKTVLRRSCEINGLPPGKYKIKIERNSESSSYNTKLSNNPTIESIKGYEVEKDMSYSNITLCVFKIISNQALSESSALKINLLTRRKNTNPSSFSKNLLTLRDFVEDIWTNTEYGLGEGIEKLDIRENLEENCNVILDSSENGFTLISDILKGYGYLFYPSGSKFVIEKDTYRFFSSYVFNESNSKDFTLNFSIPQKDEIGDGVVIKYLKQNDLNFSEFKYPLNCDYPTEYTIKGISTENQAKNRAFMLYQKQNKRGITASLTTELEGFIPDLNSRVSVSRNYLTNSFSFPIDSFLVEFNDLITTTKIKLYQKIEFKAGTNYSCLIQYADGTFISNYFNLVNFDSTGFYDEIIIEGSFEDKGLEVFITVGEEEELFKEFLVETIEPFSDDGKTMVKLNLVEYNEEVYDAPTA